MVEKILWEHHLIQSQEATEEMKGLKGADKDGNITLTDKIVPCGEIYGLQNQCPSKKRSLGFIFPGECYDIQKGSQYIFEEEFARMAIHPFVQQCFKDHKVRPLFENEKKGLEPLYLKVNCN